MASECGSNLNDETIHPNLTIMRAYTYFITLLFLSYSFLLNGQSVGVNTTTPEGTIHIRGASWIPFPNLRITDTVDHYARIKMETTLGGNRFWDIAGSSTLGFSNLSFYYKNDTIGLNILQVQPETGYIFHRSLAPSVRTLHFAKGNEYQGIVGFNHEDLLLKSARPDGRVLFGTRDMNRMTLDTIGRLGLGTETPKYLADFRSSDDILTGGELQLSTPSETNFLRLFGGRQADPNPFVAFHEADTFHLVTTSADWTTYKRRMTMLPNGFVGFGTDKPSVELDIVSGDIDDGVELHLSNLDTSHFLRLYSGRENLPNPIMYWHHGDALQFGMANPDESAYQQFLSFDGKTIGVHNTGRSVFIGEGAGTADDLSSKGNVGIGYGTLANNIDKGGHVAIGDSALYHNGIGAGSIFAEDNTAVGFRAMYSNRLGGHNTAIGHEALSNNLGSHWNTAVGFKSLHMNDGASNSADGHEALMSNTSGVHNNAFGSKALDSNQQGNDNQAFGWGAIGNNSDGSGNIGIGSSALLANQSGDGNIAIGSSALRLSSGIDGLVAIGDSALLNNGVDAIETFDGTANTAIGSNSLMNNKFGRQNTALGFQALKENISGSGNTAIGDSALHFNGMSQGLSSISSNNTAIGSRAMLKNDSGNANSAFGAYSLRDNQEGEYNTAIGLSSMLRNTEGWSNTGVGVWSLRNNLDGNANSATGFRAMDGNTGGSYNVSMGHHSMYNSTVGHENVAMGYESLYNSTIGHENVAIGESALYNNYEGEKNVAIGAGAGYNAQGLTENIYVGYEAGKNATQSNRLFIENPASINPLIYGEFDNALLRIYGRQEITGDLTVGDVFDVDENSKHVGIRTLSPSYPLDIAGTINLNKNIASGVAIRVNTDEALWYDGDYFSWGFGGNHNYSAKPMTIGPFEGSTTPFAKLHVVDDAFTYLQVESHDGDAILQLSGNTNTPSAGWTMRRDASDIGKLQWRNDDFKKMTLTPGGNLGIGVNSENPAYTLYVNGNAGKPGGGSWTNPSDRRLKQNINTYSDGLVEISKINPVTFQYNEISGHDTEPEYIGVIAQELKEVAPYMVSENEEGYLDVDNSAMTYMLINAVKELSSQNKDLLNVIDQFNTRLNEQEKILEALVSNPVPIKEDE